MLKRDDEVKINWPINYKVLQKIQTYFNGIFSKGFYCFNGCMQLVSYI